MLNDVWNITDDLLKQQGKKPYFSAILDLFCGIIGLLCVILLILPFSVDIEFLNGVKWDHNLSDHDYIVNVAFYGIFVHLTVYLVRKFVVPKTEKQIMLVYSTVYTIRDIANLIISIFFFVFMIAVFIQTYKVKEIFLSFKAVCTYFTIGLRVLAFLWVRFRARNLEIINRILKN